MRNELDFFLKRRMERVIMINKLLIQRVIASVLMRDLNRTFNIKQVKHEEKKV